MENFFVDIMSAVFQWVVVFFTSLVGYHKLFGALSKDISISNLFIALLVIVTSFIFAFFYGGQVMTVFAGSFMGITAYWHLILGKEYNTDYRLVMASMWFFWGSILFSMNSLMTIIGKAM